MKVLISVASKHGATTDIGDAIAAALEDHGLEVVLTEPDQVTSVDGFDAVIIGSGVYAGHWLAPAKRLIERAKGALLLRPVWLFSSGPLGDDRQPTDPVDVAPLVGTVRARGHRLFAGRLDRGDLNFGERAIVRVVKAPYGDFRDWPAIAEWAEEIAAELEPALVAS
jgi:menaquinone-dependent protoporphyrinogen oxidase